MTCRPVSAALAMFAILVILTGCSSTPKWDDHFEAKLPKLGAQNWIIVADSAFPEYANSDIQVLFADDDPVDTLDYVLDEIGDLAHVAPMAMIASELERIPERDAPGIDDFRRDLLKRLASITTESMPEDKIQEQLREALKTHRVLVVKSRGRIPYSAVYLKLDSAYWSSDREKRLRASIENMQ